MLKQFEPQPQNNKHHTHCTQAACTAFSECIYTKCMSYVCDDVLIYIYVICDVDHNFMFKHFRFNDATNDKYASIMYAIKLCDVCVCDVCLNIAVKSNF